MVRTMKKVTFDERVTVLNVTAIEKVVITSLLESNLNQECHEEEDAVATERELSNQLSPLSTLPTFDECREEEDPAAMHLPCTFEPTASSNFPNHSKAISSSSSMYLSRWMESNNDLNDEPPVQPLRQSIEPVNTIIKSALSIVEQPQDALPPRNKCTTIRARAA